MRNMRPIAGANVWHGKDMANAPRSQPRLTPASALALMRSRRRASLRPVAKPGRMPRRTASTGYCPGSAGRPVPGAVVSPPWYCELSALPERSPGLWIG